MRRGWDTALAAILAAAGGTATALIWTPAHLWTRLADPVYTVLGLAFALRAATFGRLPDRLRRAWQRMLPAYALWLASTALHAISPGARFPSLPDVCKLLTSLATLLGVLAFAHLPGSPVERAKLQLDAAIVAVGSAMILWYLVVSPAMTRPSSTWRELVPSVLYPLFGAALLFAVGIVLLRGPGATGARLPLLALVASILLMVIGDTLRAYLINHGGSGWTMQLQSAFWDCAMFALMAAPYLQIWYARRIPPAKLDTDPPRLTRPPRWPYLTVIPGYVALMATVGVREPFPSGGLVLGAFLVSMLAFQRQMVAARETRRLAITDPLTGLANRAQLYDVLPRALARGGRVGVLLIDLNGFKQINDTLGHAAGDRLLVGFADLLNRCVLGSDLVVRLGGDEFAVVLAGPSGATQAEAVVARIREAMSEPIDLGAHMVQPSASIGVALSEPGELSGEALLHRADLDMYAVKKSRQAA